MDAGRGCGRGRGVAAAGRGAVAAGRGAAGRGAAGRGVARGGAAGRGGRGRGRGSPEVSADSAAPSVGMASVTQSVPLAGEANIGVGRGAGAGAAPGGGAALAQGDLIVGLLTQLLARLPQAVPQQAPGAPPVAGAQVGAGVAEQQGAAGLVGQHGAAVVGHPPYLEMVREMQRIGTPTFEGSDVPEQADDWRQRLERNFGSVRYPDQ